MNFANLTAMLAAGGVAASQSESIQKTGEKLIDTAKVAAVKLELGQIRTAFVTEMAFSGGGKATRTGMPIASGVGSIKKDFSQFIRGTMTASGRDPANDFWENPYVLEEYENHYEIVSFGPDGENESDDDVWVEVPK